MPTSNKASLRQYNSTPPGTRKRTKTTVRKEEITKIRAEIKAKKAIQKINEIKSLLFKKINKIDKPLVRLNMKEMERTQVQSKNKKGDSTIDAMNKGLNNY